MVGDRLNNLYSKQSSMTNINIFLGIIAKNNDLKDWWVHTFVVEPHLFECKLKLSCVKEELEEDPGVVLRVTEHLVFNLTQSFVVWIVG